MAIRGDVDLPAEKVAYWFFRLNGCFTIENFVVHPDYFDIPFSQRTDADILGIRFPHRLEDPQSRPMVDDPAVISDVPLLFIAEIKLDLCELNGPWTRPKRGNVPRILRAAGLHPTSRVRLVAQALYSNNYYRDATTEVRMYAVGDRIDPSLQRRRENVRQLTWADILGFIHRRFTTYGDLKADHNQWDDVGRQLYDLARSERDPQQFTRISRRRLSDGHGHHLGLEA